MRPERSSSTQAEPRTAPISWLDTLLGPKPGRAFKPVVIVLDNGPIHRSKASQGRPGEPGTLAHGQVAAQIRSRLNDIEVVWRDLKARTTSPIKPSKVSKPSITHPRSRQGPQQRARKRSVGRPESPA